MPISLDKTPELPENMDYAPAYRPILTKHTALFFVVVDDQNTYDRFRWSPNFRPYRDILEVQRASTNSVERAMQEQDLGEVVDDHQSPILLMEFRAQTAGHAAGLARRAYFDAIAVQDAEDIAYRQFNA